MSATISRRRFRPRLYGRIGCLGCSVPLLAFLAAIAGVLVLVLG